MGEDESFIRYALKLSLRDMKATGDRRGMPRTKGIATLDANKLIDMMATDEKQNSGQVIILHGRSRDTYGGSVGTLNVGARNASPSRVDIRRHAASH